MRSGLSRPDGHGIVGTSVVRSHRRKASVTSQPRGDDLRAVHCSKVFLGRAPRSDNLGFSDEQFGGFAVQDMADDVQVVEGVPAGLDGQGLPLGLQLIGRPFDEETLFSLGQVIEDAAGRFSPHRWWG